MRAPRGIGHFSGLHLSFPLAGIVYASATCVMRWSLIFNLVSRCLNLKNKIMQQLVCHACKDWWNVKGAIQRLPANYVPTCPYKKGRPAALRSLPLADDPTKATVDPAHTWAIAGVGKDFLGSTLVLCASMGLFREGSMQVRLQQGYDKFQTYLVRKKKYTSIHDFSNKTLKCAQSPLV